MPDQPAVLQLRVAVTTSQFKELLQFYSDGLGLQPAEHWTRDGGGEGVLVWMGRASLEIFDEAFAAGVDEAETGRRTSGPVRFAIQVPDLQAAVERLTAAGAALVSPPVLTPWGDTNARLQDPDGRQVTLFQAPGSQGSP